LVSRQLFHPCTYFSPSEGLIPIDNTLNDCQDISKGQVYARAYSEPNELDGQLAIMYIWYIPKEMHKPEPGKPLAVTQHKHGWHWIVVYLSSNKADATIKKIAYQGAGSPIMLTTPSLSGTSPNVLYKEADDKSYSVSNSAEPGEQQKLLAWERFTKSAKQAISETDFGGSKAPFGDYNTFKTTVIQAWGTKKVGA